MATTPAHVIAENAKASKENSSTTKGPMSTTKNLDKLTLRRDPKLSASEEAMQARVRMRRSLTLKQILHKINSGTEPTIDLDKLRKVDISEENIHAILDALEKNDRCVALSASGEEIYSEALRKRLHGIITKKIQLRAIHFVDIPVVMATIQGLRHLPLKHLALFNCEVEDGMVFELAQSQTIDRLFIHNDKQSTKQITATAAIKILQANRVTFLLLHCTKEISEAEEKAVTEAFVKNTSIKTLNNFMFNDPRYNHDIKLRIFEARKTICSTPEIGPGGQHMRFRFRHQINFKGQREINFYEAPSSSKFDQIVKDKSGVELKKILDELNFSPDSYASGDDDNPIINVLIANETHYRALKVVEAFPGGIDFNRKDMEGKTALIIAAKTAVPRRWDRAGTASSVVDMKTNSDRADFEQTADAVFLAILSNGDLELNAQDDQGCTALHYLALYKKHSLFKATVTRGADINIMDNEGRTPLDYCALPPQTQRDIMICMTIDPDRDIEARHNCSLSDEADVNTLRGSFAGTSLIEACNDPDVTQTMATYLVMQGGASFIPNPFLETLLSKPEFQFKDRFQEIIDSTTNLSSSNCNNILEYLWPINGNVTFTPMARAADATPVVTPGAAVNSRTGVFL